MTMTASDGGGRVGGTLTEAEADFVDHMRSEDEPTESRWQSFDPDFRQKDIARLIRRGWFEKRGEGRRREYRWTDAGRLALASVPSPSSNRERR